MSAKLYLENFEEIYNDTYDRTLRYIITKCSNIDDVNDLLQDTYVEFYKLLQKKKYIELDNCQNYIIGIAKKKIYKHYGLLYRIKTSPLFNRSDEKEYEVEIPDDINLEDQTITKLNAEMVWDYIKTKNINVVKIFYLYYYSGFKISQIADELDIRESNVKNLLYRTIKDIKQNVKIGGDVGV
ncbi:sigma-70 family RNA polymerase sigma factor [Intestinibacter bartlettii]|uniref:RNA polymerase sigma factor n=2 Tax=Intestinibacter bartlettii TaxID=261299 RepID=UPI00319DAC0C